jgi:arylsulfatase
MINKSWTITASIDLPNGNENGMIITHGGLEGGYGLYLKDGRPTFVYNYLGTERTAFAGKESLAKGKTKLVVDFKYDGPGDAKGVAALGKGGTITVSSNDKTIAQGRLEKTIPIQFSLGEGVDIGTDVGSPVDFTYKLPFTFTGKIEQVTVELR